MKLHGPIILLIFFLSGLLDSASAQTIVYNQSFTGGVAPTTQCAAWNSFRALLLPSYTYNGFTISGSANPTGISCINPVIAQNIANALRTGTAYTVYDATATPAPQTWTVDFGCSTGSGCVPTALAVEFGNVGSCACLSGYAVRPAIGNIDWGGINGPTCGGSSQIMIVTFHAGPASPSISGATQYCTGGMITLTASSTAPGPTYSWTGPASFTATTASISVAASVSTAGTYSCTVTSGGNTSLPATVTVSVVNPPAISIGPDPEVCTGSTSANLGYTSATGWPTTYTIIYGATALAAGFSNVLSAALPPSPVPLVIPPGAAAGSYAGTITVHNAVCAAAGTAFSVHIRNTPSSITGTTSICTGNLAVLGNAVSGGTWTSSNSSIASVSASGTVTGVSIGSCTITYSTAPGCFVTSPMNVSASPAAFSGGTVCEGQSHILTNATTGGTWSSENTAIAIIGSTTGVLTGISVGTTAITYSTSANCYAVSAVTVNSIPNPGVISGPNGLCIGDIVVLTDSVPGGAWSGSNSSAVVSGGTVTGLTAGTALISYTISNLCGSAIATKTITVAPLPLVSGLPQMCAGKTTTLSADIAGGTWLSSDTTVAAVSGGLVNGVSAGTAVILYFIHIACKATYPVTVNPLPETGVITGQPVLCIGAQVRFGETVTGGTWSSSDTGTARIGNDGWLLAKDTGTTEIAYAIPPNAYGCRNSVAMQLSVVLTSFAITGTVTNVKCYDGTEGRIELGKHGANGFYEYIWSSGDTTADILNVAAGVYTVTATDTNTHCVATEQFTVSGPDSLWVSSSITFDQCSAGNGSIDIIAHGGSAPYNYLWSGNSMGTGISGLSAGTYSLSIADVNNCRKTFYFELRDTTCTDIVIHDGVSPNGDGINDMWIIEGLDQFPANSVQVFDKFGDLVFEQAHYQNNWNGRGKNGLLPDGTYYYHVKLNRSNIKNTHTGTLLLKR